MNQRRVIRLLGSVIWLTAAAGTAKAEAPTERDVLVALHPNGDGHRQMAIELFKVLGIFDPATACCHP